MTQKAFKILGWVATCTAMLMYISYFPQIMNNIHGNKSGFLQPMVAAINCTLWVCYGFFQKKRIGRLSRQIFRASYLARLRRLPHYEKV